MNNLSTKIIDILTSNNGTNIVNIDISSNQAITDNIIIVSGTSTKHNITLAEKVISFFKEHGYKNLHVDGLQCANWIAIDSGNIVVHIFLENVRDYYKIEKIWLPK